MTDNELTDLWQQIQANLRPRMTQATYDTCIQPTRPVSLDGPSTGSGQAVLTVYSPAKEWLENRLDPIIARAASDVAGRPVRVVYVNGVEHSETSPATEQPPAPNPSTSPLRRAQDAASTSSGCNSGRSPKTETRNPALDDEALALASFDQSRAHYSKHPQYLSIFWRPYLGNEAYAVWEYVRDVYGDSKAVWTPIRDFTTGELTERADCSPQALHGVWRGCERFYQHLVETGETLPECCGSHPDTEMTVTKPTRQFPDGRATCRRWVPGALEILQQEGIAVWRKLGTAKRDIRYRIQVYQYPPLLTPYQVDRLSAAARISHGDFIGKRLGLDVAAWERVQMYSFLAIKVNLDGLTLDLPEVGVLSAAAMEETMANFKVIRAAARNTLFFRVR